jgi:hypothetical protein
MKRSFLYGIAAFLAAALILTGCSSPAGTGPGGNASLPGGGGGDNTTVTYQSVEVNAKRAYQLVITAGKYTLDFYDMVSGGSSSSNMTSSGKVVSSSNTSLTLECDWVNGDGDKIPVKFQVGLVDGLMKRITAIPTAEFDTVGEYIPCDNGGKYEEPNEVTPAVAYLIIKNAYNVGNYPIDDGRLNAATDSSGPGNLQSGVSAVTLPTGEKIGTIESGKQKKVKLVPVDFTDSDPLAADVELDVDDNYTYPAGTTKGDNNYPAYTEIEVPFEFGKTSTVTLVVGGGNADTKQDGPR